MSESFLNNRVTLHAGDCLDVMAMLAENSIDSCVTDPPYALVSIVKRFGKPNSAPAKGNDAYMRASAGFMGKTWDTGDTAFNPDFWREVLRVLKPGAHLVAFSGTRTYHRIACAIEDAGFEIRDQIGYCYGTGFPKSHNVKKAAREAVCGCPTSSDFLPSVRDAETCSIRMEKAEQPGFLQPELPLQDGDGADIGEACLQRKGWMDQRESRFVSGKNDRREKSCVEGGNHISKTPRELCERQICEVPAGVSVDGASRWLCDGTPHSNGETDWETVNSEGMCPPPGSSATKQCADEFGAMARQQKSQVGRAWQDCRKCGKPIIPDGLGTALKPAWEPIVLARKPLSEPTVAANVLRWGTGAINVDGCRIPSSGDVRPRGSSKLDTDMNDGWARPWMEDRQEVARRHDAAIEWANTLGRWPANLCHDGSDEVVAAFPNAPGQQRSVGPEHVNKSTVNVYGDYGPRDKFSPRNDSGSAARFFFQAQQNKIEQVVITWISESEPCQATLLVDTGQLPGKAIVALGSTTSKEWSTFLSGNVLTGLFRMASTCTIRTATNSTIESKTWNYLISLLTNACIADVNYETVNGGNHAETAESGERSLIITLGKTESFPGASRAASGTQLKISVSAGQNNQQESSNNRFWYSAKANKDDRVGSSHPTVKPIDLIQWLCRLFTPPGGTVLDCFAGTGTTAEAAYREGFSAILIERESEYQADIRRRMELILSGPDERKRASIKARGKLESAGPLFGTEP